MSGKRSKADRRAPKITAGPLGEEVAQHEAHKKLMAARELASLRTESLLLRTSMAQAKASWQSEHTRITRENERLRRDRETEHLLAAKWFGLLKAVLKLRTGWGMKRKIRQEIKAKCSIQ